MMSIKILDGFASFKTISTILNYPMALLLKHQIMSAKLLDGFAFSKSNLTILKATSCQLSSVKGIILPIGFITYLHLAMEHCHMNTMDQHTVLL